jgi:hypothetical protein
MQTLRTAHPRDTMARTHQIAHHTVSRARARFLQLVARAVTVVLLATMALTSVGAGGAEALTTANQGSHGYYSFQRVGGQTVYSSSFGPQPGLRINGPYVTRSAASASTQAVLFQAVVEQQYPDGRWVKVWDSGWRSTTLAPGQAGYLANLYVPLGSGIFRVQEFLVWKDAWGRNLGGVGASYDASGDYYCSIVSCSVGRGFIRV